MVFSGNLIGELPGPRVKHGVTSKRPSLRPSFPRKRESSDFYIE